MPGIRPLLKLSFAVGNALHLGATGFHAVNLTIHAANTLLVYLLLASRHRAAATLAALIFAVAPVQTEAVTYVSGRSTSLAALFALASLLAWTRGRPWLSSALFAVSLLVKEFTIVVPVAILLWEATSETRRPLRPLLAHAGVVLLAAVIAAASPTYRHLAATSWATRSPLANLAAQSHAIPYLTRQVVRPDLLNADPALSPSVAWDAFGVFSALAILALLVYTLLRLRRHPVASFGILWFFLWIAPTNSLLARLDVVNDRQVYVALIGPAWIAGYLAARLLRSEARVAIAALALAFLLGTATHARNQVYLSETAFWEDVTRKSPGNARAFNNLGYAYGLVHRDAEAERALRRALEIDPDYVRAAVNLKLLRAGALTDAPKKP